MPYASALGNISFCNPTSSIMAPVDMFTMKKQTIMLPFCLVFAKRVLCPFLYLKMNLVSLGDPFPENTTVKIAFPISVVCTLQEAEAGRCEKEGSRFGEAWSESSVSPDNAPRSRGLCPVVMQILATRLPLFQRKERRLGCMLNLHF